MSGDQRHGCIGCANHPFVSTPNMDRLAAEGVRFINGFTAVPFVRLAGPPIWPDFIHISTVWPTIVLP